MKFTSFFCVSDFSLFAVIKDSILWATSSLFEKSLVLNISPLIIIDGTAIIMKSAFKVDLSDGRKTKTSFKILGYNYKKFRGSTTDISIESENLLVKV